MGTAPTSPPPPTAPGRRPALPGPERRRRLLRRLVPILALALVALVAGVVVGAGHEPAERRVAERFLAAWQRADYGAMYELLDDGSRRRVSATGFAAAYRAAAETATLRGVSVGRVRAQGDTYTARVRARTARFATLRGDTSFAVTTTDDRPGVAWKHRLVFPGLRAGERLRSETRLPPRGTLQARDGRVIAEGPERTGALGALSAEVAGQVGPIPPERAPEYAARGYPADAQVGLGGLERTFETRLAGTFGGTLRAGSRVLATARARQAPAVRTSIDPKLEAAAVTALAGRYGGIAVLRPRSGEVLALAGLAYSAPQPPGSTFKIITLSGALDAGVTKLSDDFPVQTSATLSGVELQNANGEACGGSLLESFAESCNSVFAPMGAKLGATRLVAAAERFGFNRAPDLPGAPMGSIPPASEIGDDLAVGSTAIGQGKTTATPLRMAEVAGAIANRGELVGPTLLRGGRGGRRRATTPRTARVVTRAMRLVVKQGTGSAAAVTGVSVAGKTGTAELRSTVRDESTPIGEDAGASDTADTTAWFVAFAPSRRPSVVVAVMLIGQGAGGATAAPAAKTVLQAAVG